MSSQTEYIVHYKLRCDHCIGDALHVAVTDATAQCECVRCGHVREIPDGAQVWLMKVTNHGESQVHV